MYNIGEKMLIKTQPNRWSCVVAAFATATNLEFETLIDLIGHDGSHVIFDDLAEPECYQGFHVQEAIYVLYKLGYSITAFDLEPLAFHDEKHVYTVNFKEHEIFEIMQNSIGVACGKIKGTEKTHAFAWNGVECYDPTGFIYPLSRFELYSYFAISKRVEGQ